jgi:hypothetical protein
MPAWPGTKLFTAAAAALTIAFAGFGVSQIGEYGQTIDETHHRLRGQFTVDYLRLLLEKKRIPSEHDVALLASNLSIQASSDVDLNHPLLFPLLSLLASRFLQSSLGLPNLPAAHLPLLLFASLGLWHLALLARLLFTERVAIYSLLLLAFFPPFIAHAQYNPKDTPVMAAVVIALYHCCRAAGSGRWQQAAGTGLLSAFAICTKLDGLFILPVFGLALFARKDWRRFRLGPYLLALCAGTFVLWPLLWTEPLQPWRALQHFSTSFHVYPELFLGKATQPQDLPWFYSPLYLFFATPAVTAILACAGLLALLRRRGDRFAAALVLLWLTIPVGVRLLPEILKYGGMRHLFISVPPLTIVAALGLDSATRWLGEHFSAVASWLLVTLVGGLLTAEIVRVHPFEGMYFNEISRAALGPELQDRFDLDRWLASYQQGSRWIDEHAARGATVCAPFAPWLAANRALRPDLRRSCGPSADYVLRASTQLEPEAGFQARVEREYKVVHRLRRLDSTILTVYGRATLGL